MVANWNIMVNYHGITVICCGILTLENVGTVVNYHHILIRLTPGDSMVSEYILQLLFSGKSQNLQNSSTTISREK